ncbi:MAG: hypothetical protein JSS20_14250 [Proteobacteria bacterium]|nr:hypothetical protein [Pseudomonadota bacterium]
MSGFCGPAAAQQSDDAGRLVTLLSAGSFLLADESGVEIGVRRRASQPVEPLTEAQIARQLGSAKLSGPQAVKLWAALGEHENRFLLTMPIIRAAIAASASVGGHEALWHELDLQSEGKRNSKALLSLFEKNRQSLLPLLTGLRETEDTGDYQADLLENSRIFGTQNDGVRWLAEYNIGALAHRMEDERMHGTPVPWEAWGFDLLRKWKASRFGANAPQRATTLAALDSDSETFIIIFNNMHAFGEERRRQMLSGISPMEAFGIVVGGEFELYRLGTSGYRNFLHPLITRGVAEAGSLEAFLAKTVEASAGKMSQAEAERRGMVFLRIVSSFGLLEQTLSLVRDHKHFIDAAVQSLADPATLEASASVVLDILGGASTEPVTTAFRRELLDRFYGLNLSEQDPKLKSVIGSVLSVYQTLSGDRRDADIDRRYAIARSLTEVGFADLFSPDAGGGFVHRIFMRLSDDTDARSNYAAFRATMSARGAEAIRAANYEAYRIRKNGRVIEIYLNRPTEAGTLKGIDELASVLNGVRIHTVVGRGHTGIIAPLREDAKKILGTHAGDVAMVIVGACGGSASVRDLVDTFGYRTIVSTRATGRQVINSSVLETYFSRLFALPPDGKLDMNALLGDALAPYLRKGVGEALREDARFYQINTASVYAAMLFDRHVRGKPVSETVPTSPDSERPNIVWRQAAHTVGD